jgi:hypothetical protein
MDRGALGWIWAQEVTLSWRSQAEDRWRFLGLALLQNDLFVVASGCQSSPDGQLDAVGYKVGASVGHRNGDSRAVKAAGSGMGELS